MRSVRIRDCGGGGGGGDTGGKKSFAGVRAKLFWCFIYSANLRPDERPQSGSRSRKGLGGQASWTICGYDLSTVIVIRTLIQSHMCRMGSFIFSAMS